MTQEQARPAAIIVDMDGTLCDVTGIRHYVLDGHSFIRAVTIWIERPAARYVTGTWLRKWEVPFDRLWMRRDGDYRPDREVKLDILRKIQTTHEVIYAIDDNPAVLALWAEQKIPTIEVPGWYA